MSLSTPAKAWKHRVDRIMRREFAIDLDDAGAGDDDVARYFAAGDTPEGFVEWFGDKYGLERPADIWPTAGRRRR